MSAADVPDRINALIASPREHDGVRVVTLKDVDRVHDRPEGTARRNFNENAGRFVEGRDYFTVSRETFLRTPNGNGDFSGVAPIGADLVLLTERGYVKVTKPMRDPLAWEVADQVLDGYFAGRDLSATLLRLAQDVTSLRAEVAQSSADLKAARADTFKLACELRTTRSALGKELGKEVDPRFRVLAQEDPEQGRMFLSYGQIVEDRARLAAGRVTSTEAAALLGVTVRGLGRLVKDGAIVRDFPGSRRPYLLAKVQTALVARRGAEAS